MKSPQVRHGRGTRAAAEPTMGFAPQVLPTGNIAYQTPMPIEDDENPLRVLCHSSGFRSFTIKRDGKGYWNWTLKYTDGAGCNLYAHGYAPSFDSCRRQAADAIVAGNWRKDRYP